MDNSVIISSIEQRIGYYASSAGINNNVVKKYIKTQISKFNDIITQPQLLFIERLLCSFDLAMGDKRTTEKMYLERDLKNIEDMHNRLFSIDKNKGRNFVNTMRQNVILANNFSINELDDNGINKSNGRSLTKANSSSNAYKLYSNE